MNVWAIADIHGCSKTFECLLSKISFSKSDKLFILGDLINRGPDSKSVLDIILRLKADNYSVDILKGNHDHLMEIAIKDDSFNEFLKRNKRGYVKTLKSFRINKASELDQSYKEFLIKLPYYLTFENIFMVHAALNDKREEYLNDYHAMIWDRKSRLIPKSHSFLIHGHVTVNLNCIRESLVNGKRHFSIDNGCVFENEPGFGNLVAVNLINFKLAVQNRLDTI